jgi:hypothetical protein
MPAARIIQLRQLLTKRFPGSRPRLNESSRAAGNFRPGLRQREEVPWPDFSPGALTEIVAEKQSSGSALLLNELIRRAGRENQLVALVDGGDSFDVTRLEANLSRLLWVRCRSAGEALKAADLLLRDRNLPLVLLDLAANPAVQLNKIPATTWYRFQRLVEQTSTVCVVLTSRAMVSPARTRMVLSSRFSLSALDRCREELLAELKVRLAETRRSGRAPLQNTA